MIEDVDAEQFAGLDEPLGDRRDPRRRGSGSPEGWLWARMHGRRREAITAGLNTSRGWTIEALRLPTQTVSMPMTSLPGVESRTTRSARAVESAERRLEQLVRPRRGRGSQAAAFRDSWRFVSSRTYTGRACRGGEEGLRRLPGAPGVERAKKETAAEVRRPKSGASTGSASAAVRGPR